MLELTRFNEPRALHVDAPDHDATGKLRLPAGSGLAPDRTADEPRRKRNRVFERTHRGTGEAPAHAGRDRGLAPRSRSFQSERCARSGAVLATLTRAGPVTAPASPHPEAAPRAHRRKPARDALVADAGLLEHLRQMRGFGLDDVVEFLRRIGDRNDEL